MAVGYRPVTERLARPGWIVTLGEDLTPLDVEAVNAVFNFLTALSLAYTAREVHAIKKEYLHRPGGSKRDTE